MLSTVPRPPSHPAGYIISAWAKDGRLAVGRCAEPQIPDLGQREMVKSWVVRDTSKAFGRATFGDDFSHPGPSCVYGGTWDGIEMTASDLRVFAIDFLPPGIPLKHPLIIAAPSVTAAMKGLKVSRYHLSRHPMPVISEEDRARALAQPGVCLSALGGSGK